MAPPPTLYIDLMSQPSRACYILCKMYQLPVAIRMVRVDKAEHKQPPYLAINPLGKVPFLTHGELKLPESVAIMTYIADTYGLPTGQWHPAADPAASANSSSSSAAAGPREAALARSARFNAATHWQHLTVRRGCMTLAFSTVIGPRVFKVPASPAVAKHGLQVLKQALADLDSYWLQGGHRPFMTGDRVSTADVLCCCELEQLRMMAAEPSWPQLADLLAAHPTVKAWMARVRQAVGPAVYDDAHGTLAAAVQRLAAAAAGGGSGGGGAPAAKL